jgi:hypothetical protein
MPSADVVVGSTFNVQHLQLWYTLVIPLSVPCLALTVSILIRAKQDALLY